MQRRRIWKVHSLNVLCEKHNKHGGDNNHHRKISSHSNLDLMKRQFVMFAFCVSQDSLWMKPRSSVFKDSSSCSVPADVSTAQISRCFWPESPSGNSFSSQVFKKAPFLTSFVFKVGVCALDIWQQKQDSLSLQLTGWSNGWIFTNTSISLKPVEAHLEPITSHWNKKCFFFHF